MPPQKPLRAVVRNGFFKQATDLPRVKENRPECSDERQAMKSALAASSSESRCAIAHKRRPVI